MDLKLVLMDSAQCFCWTERDGWYGAVLMGTPVWLSEGSEGIIAEGGERAFLRHYLDLDRDYDAMKREYDGFPTARRALELYPGLRVLNQSPWDALVMFILSANNNVGRIRKLCEGLAQQLGTAYDTPRGRLYALPSPQKLAACDEKTLRALGTGYRAPYLIGTAQMVSADFPLEELKGMDYEAAHERLLEFPGVGDKVADCVLLFGCEQASAFPVDVWMERLLRGWFGIEAKGRKELARAARDLFGPHAGLLQQFLFHAARTGGIDLPSEEKGS